MGKYEQNEHLWVIKKKKNTSPTKTVLMNLYAVAYTAIYSVLDGPAETATWWMQWRNGSSACSEIRFSSVGAHDEFTYPSAVVMEVHPCTRLMVMRQLECNHPHSAHVDEMNCRVNRYCDFSVSSQTTWAIQFYSKSYNAQIFVNVRVYIRLVPISFRIIISIHFSTAISLCFHFHDSCYNLGEDHSLHMSYS